VEGNLAFVPVREGYSADLSIPKRRRYHGRGYQMIGDLAVIHGKHPTREEIEKILKWRRPRGVLWVRGFSGIERIPEVEVLHGEAGEVKHREAGILYFLDPARVMFAQGNRKEKSRITGLLRTRQRNERVADMFAGIGYFTLTMARTGACVHAMEINTVAYGYLCRNIAANNLAGLVTAECGDCRTLLSGEYDRIMMGHFDAISILPIALKHAREGTVLHVHSLGPVENQIREAVGSAGFSAQITTHRVKKYSPGKRHLVQDVVLL
jgi:tRNA wybutosine-synthesizing protein 2